MDKPSTPAGKPAGPDRPRRRDIVLTVLLGIVVLFVVMLTGGITLDVFLASAGAFAALAAIYYAAAATGTDPDLRVEAPTQVNEQAKTAHETMLERLPIPVLMIGPGGRIEHANPAAATFLGLGVQNGLLSTVLRQPRVLEAVSNALRGERGGVVEYSTLAPHESHVRAFVEPIRLDIQSPMQFRAMLVLADDTSSKRAERMRADFLANASHELRTPLASLAGFVDTLSGPARDDEAARDRFLSIMQQQTERMRHLIDDLLSLSRVEMNEHMPPTDEVDLNDIIANVRESIGPVAQKRAITLQVKAHDGPARVVGDAHQIYEVVENLVENAIKYSSDGSQICLCAMFGTTRDEAEHQADRLTPDAGRLTLAAPAFDPDARYGVVRVVDHGQGIERRFLPRLAERFFRVDGQKSGPKSGTGLGLAIVKHIVSRHRGGFTVESAPGSGSIFSVFFPVAGGPAARQPAPVDADHAAE